MTKAPKPIKAGKAKTGKTKKAKTGGAKKKTAPPPALEPSNEPSSAPALEASVAGAAEAARAVSPEPARPGGVFRLAGLAAFVLIFFGTGYLTWPFWSHVVAPYIPGLETPPPSKQAAKPQPAPPSVQEMKTERQQMRQELSLLMGRMEAIESSLETVTKMVHATARSAEDKSGGAASGASVQALLDRLGALEKNGGEVKALIQRLDKLEKDDTQQAAVASAGSGSSAKAQALVLAVANLREALALGGPFQGALDTLTAIGGEDPSIKTASVLLAKDAVRGIPALAGLRDRFDGLAGEIVRDSKMVAEGSWMDKATNRLASLVTWRRVDNREDASSVDAAVARAETRLKEGDLGGAVKALEGLSGNKKAQARAEPWLRDAKARLVAERAVATLHVYAISLLVPAKE